MNIVSWILFGLIGGLIAYAFEDHPSKAYLHESLLLGTLGAFCGGFIASMLLRFTDLRFSLISFFIAVAGTVFILTSNRLLKSA